MPAGSWQQSSGTVGQGFDRLADHSGYAAPLVGYGQPLGVLLLELEHMARPGTQLLGLWVNKAPQRSREKALHHQPCVNAESTSLISR